MRKPSFLLKPSAYKTDKLYAILPYDGNGDMSVSGYVGNGTRVNKDGFIETVATDTPRLDYRDGSGVLLEPTRTNVWQYSESPQTDMTVTSGALANDNTVIAPDGSLGASYFEDTSSSVDGFISKNITFSDATKPHAFSFFIKFKYGPYISLSVFGLTTADIAIIKIEADGTLSTTSDPGGIVSKYSAENYPNGWMRISVVLAMDSTDTSGQFGFSTGDYEGSGTSFGEEAEASVWLWGLQLEDGAFSTSYIPATGASNVTRTNDILTLSTTISKGFVSSDYHSVFIDVSVIQAIGDSTNTTFLFNTTGEGYLMNQQATDSYPRIGVTTGPAEYYTLLGGRNKILFTGNDTQADAWVNGTKVLDVTASIDVTTATITLSGVGASWKLHEMALWDFPLNSLEAKQITQ